MNAETQQITTPRKNRYFPGLLTIIVVLIALAGVVFFQLTDVTRDRALANIYSFGLEFVVFVWMWIWFLAFSSYSRTTRCSALGGFVTLIVAFFICFRLVQFTGDLWPVFAWRWTSPLEMPNPDDGKIDLKTTTPHDFPQFLGPKRDLSLTHIRLKTPWSKYPPKLMWRIEIGDGWSGFVAVNGYAVTMEQRDEKEMVTCYNIESGEIEWYYAHDARYDTRLGVVGPRATPTIHKGMVYALGATGILVCLDGADGTLKWKKDLLKEFGKTIKQEESDLPFGRSNSPLVVDDMVIVPIGGPPGKRVSLAAFRLKDGELVWKGGTRHISYSSPNIVTLAGKRQIIIVNEAHTAAHDVKSGQVLWEFDWDGRSNANAISSQAVPVGDDSVFVSKGYGGGSMLMRILRGKNGEFSTKKIWLNPRDMRTKYTNVAIKGDHVYGLSDGILECIRLKTGKRVWKGGGYKNGRYGHGQILRVSDHLIVCGEDGNVSIVEATPDEANRNLGTIECVSGITWNNVALFGEYLLVRNAKQAACYRLEIED